MGKQGKKKQKIPDQPRQSIDVSLEELIELAKKAHKNGMVTKAAEFYDAILKLKPDNAEVLHFSGILKHQLGNSKAGLKLIRKSIALTPGSAMMHNNLGNVLREMDCSEEAEIAYRTALEHDPDDANALCNLGVSLHNQNKNDEAVSFLRKAIGINPKHGESYHNLGNLYREQRQFEDAIENYGKAVEFEGYKNSSNSSAISLALVLASSGKQPEAEKMLRDMLDRQPDNPVAQHILAALSGMDVPTRASDGYVVEAFQSYASTFDESLARLEYRAPELVGNRIKEILSQPSAQFSICDLGCGTGLVAQYIKPYAEKLVGVDLSVNMLIQARKRQAYDELIEGEITEHLKKSEGQYDLITCVDTLCYLGELDDIMKYSGLALKSGGHLCFTVEKLDDESKPEKYALAHHGRYQHKQNYLNHLLQKYRFAKPIITDVVLRNETGRPVSGLLVSAQLG